LAGMRNEDRGPDESQLALSETLRKGEAHLANER
jgi:hypothetical protein